MAQRRVLYKDNMVSIALLEDSNASNEPGSSKVTIFIQNKYASNKEGIGVRVIGEGFLIAHSDAMVCRASDDLPNAAWILPKE